MAQPQTHNRTPRSATAVLLLGYALFVGQITLTPRMPGSEVVSREVDRLVDVLHDRAPSISVDFLFFEFIGNILMFVPFGIFCAMLIPQRLWWILLFLGTLLSATIELFQLLFLPERFPEVRDLISNSTGFLLGAAISWGMCVVMSCRETASETRQSRSLG